VRRERENRKRTFGGREYGVSLNGFGKTVFLTREEAEKALAEMEGKKDGV
jgi:hypothetical protein